MGWFGNATASINHSHSTQAPARFLDCETPQLKVLFNSCFLSRVHFVVCYYPGTNTLHYVLLRCQQNQFRLRAKQNAQDLQQELWRVIRRVIFMNI